MNGTGKRFIPFRRQCEAVINLLFRGIRTDFGKVNCFDFTDGSPPDSDGSKPAFLLDFDASNFDGSDFDASDFDGSDSDGNSVVISEPAVNLDAGSTPASSTNHDWTV
ncbi:hypothetical protein ECOLIN_14325 [Escherichia coli Nissle 1917]|nr:hypothetical protein ECOLIN_14325 [Escherichia coli Nissle 1917]